MGGRVSPMSDYTVSSVLGSISGQMSVAGTMWESTCRTSYPRMARCSAEAMGSQQQRERAMWRAAFAPLTSCMRASSRTDMESDLPLAPASCPCGTTWKATSQPHKIARRHQSVEYNARGDASGALAAAATVATRASAIEALEVDMRTASASGPTWSLLNTWTMYHLEWFGESVDLRFHPPKKS